MKKLIALLAAAISGALTLTAATPIAVWDGANSNLGDFSLTAQNGNTIQNNAITIASGATGGVVYTGANSALNNCTFIIRCSGLNFANANNQYLLSLHQNSLGGGNGDASYNKVGVSLAANNAAVRGIWENAFYGNNNMQVADPFSSGTDIVINIQTSGGVFVYEIVTDAETGARSLVKRYGNVNLKASNTNYKGFSLGGKYEKNSTNLSPATGWTISKMAVFGSTLSESEILGYEFPSDITIPVNENTSVSALNALIAASSGSKVIFSVAAGVEIDVDTAFVASVPVEVASSGTITLSADSQPDASYFTNVNFGGVKGALLRSWLPTPGVVGFNFNANGGQVANGNATGNPDGAADTSLALEIGTWYKNAGDCTGSSSELFADGISVLSWTAKNVYAEVGGLTSGTFIQGYLDDGNNVRISLTGVPYETYDVIIYCSTDDSSKSFKAKTVNGTIYTWDSTAGETTTTGSDTATWGLASAAAGKAVYGANTLRINGLSGPLSIKGGTSGNNARGCISAFQIMPAGTSTAPEMTVGTAGQTAQATWTGATWNVATAPTSGNVIINVSGDVELTIDETVALSAITVNGEGSLKIIPDQPNNVTFTASSISSAAQILFANDGIAIATISAPVTYLYKTTSINSATHGNTYTAGVGEQDSSVAISHNGGSVTLQGAIYYLGESYNGTATTVTFDDATAVYADCGVGMATYSIEGSSSITAQRLILSQGANDRTAVMLVKDTASVNVTGTSDVDSNQASIMFGHWNGPSTFTIQDSATFTAASQVLIGKTRNNHTININGGTFTARGIKTASYATGTNTLNLNGGLLVLGDVGIDRYGTTSISVNTLDDSEIRASAATLPISQAVTIAADKVLSFTTSQSESLVELTGVISGTGGISVGAGVTLKLGTIRFENEIFFDENGSLSVALLTKVDQPVFKATSAPSAVILYDTDGTTVLEGATFDYDDEAGTITVKPPVNTWNVSENLSFDTAANWTSGLPESTQDTAIKVTGDVTLTIAETYEAATLTISGSGVVEFSGEGSFTVGTLYLNDGATLAPNSKVLASSIVLASGTVLHLEDKTEATPISGAGAVETYGDVTFSGNNTFSGGLTVKSGTARTTTATGFGPNRYGQAIGNLARITVEDGGSLDLNGTKDTCYAITIAGKGVENNGVYSGALYNSGPEIGYNSRQTASLTLSADAMVKAEASTNGWGIVNSGHAASVLALNGHTLTVSGEGTFPIVNANTANGTQTTGTLIADGVTLGLVSTACNLTGVDVVAKGCASINIATAPTAIGSLTIKPSATGTTASNWNLPSSPIPIIDSSNIDTTGLTDGQVLTIFTAPSGTALSSETISVQASGRFTTVIDGETIKATFNAGMPANFMHYDFNNGAAVDTGKASDSGTQISSVGEASSVNLVGSRNGQAIQVHTNFTPWWDTLANGISPFHDGKITVTTVAKLLETDIILWGLGAGAQYKAIGLVVQDANTVAVVARRGTSNAETLVTVKSTKDLTRGWHFFAVVSDENGTKLYVDDDSASSDKGVPAGFGQQGQLGSFHGSAFGGKKVGDDGYYLDDWRVYDTVLTGTEIRKLRNELLPKPFILTVR